MKWARAAAWVSPRNRSYGVCRHLWVATAHAPGPKQVDSSRDRKEVGGGLGPSLRGRAPA